MPAPARSRVGRTCAGPRRAGLALLALLSLSTPARGADLTGRADLTYADNRYSDSTSEFLRQMYLVEYRRHVSTATSYRLSLRYQDDRGTADLADGPGRLRSRILEPSGVIDHRLDGFGLSATFRRYREETLDANGHPFTRSIARYGTATYVRPFERAEVTLGVDRLAFEAAEVSTRDDRIALSFRYASEGLQLSNENRLQFFEDAGTGLSRMSMGPRLAASYTRNIGEAYSFSGTYVFDYLRSEQRAQADTVLSELQPSSGLFVNDDLPVDTDPLSFTPALIDRIFDASAGISLGPTGESFQNIGIDMGRIAALEELRIHVRSADGAPVPDGGPISWTVYASLDGVRWGAVDGAIAVFSTAMSAYVLTFPPTSNRFFKAVNFGVNTLDTVVTEVQSFTRETLRPDQLRVSSAVRQGLTLVATGRPWSRLILTAAMRGSADVLSFQGGDRWSTDAGSSVDARVGPFGPVTLGAGHLLTFAREALGSTQTSNTVTGSVRYAPIERFDARLEARRTDDQIERTAPLSSARAATTSVTLSTRVEPYATVRANASGGFTVQDVQDQGIAQYVTAAGGINLDVHRDARVGLAATLQRPLSDRGETSQLDALPFIQFATHELYTAELEYRASSRLRLLARVGYAAGELEEGFVQSYRAAWNPFPDGALQVIFDYVEDVDPLSGRSIRRLSASPYWAVNRHTVLQLSYNMVRGRGNDRTSQENLNLTLSIRL